MTPADLARLRELEGQDTKGPCIEFAGAKDNHGYGMVRVGERTVRAHRLAWSKVNGPIPTGKHILHRCDNPACVNPDHLYAGSHADNMADIVAHGRGANAMTRNPHTHCPAGHAYDQVNTRTHKGKRYCRACQRERARKRSDAPTPTGEAARKDQA